MAYSYNVYTGNGSTTQFTVGVPYIRREHVKVYVAYVDTAYTYVNNTTVQLATAPTAGQRVEVRRVTPFANVLVDFTDGSTLVAADLDTSNLQHLYLEQELDDASKQAIYVDPASGQLTTGGQQIKNVADPTAAQDAATKAYTDTQDALRLKRDGTQAMTGALPMGGFKVTGAADPTSAQDLATKAYVDTTTVASAGDSMTGPLAMGGNKVTGLGAPTANADAVTKSYVDGYVNTFYLGGASTNPTTRQGGSPLQNGDYYINLPTYQLRFYDGSAWNPVDIPTEQNRILAQTAQTGAETARTGAETARTGAETARTGAETAQTGALAAKSGAETAQAGAITAKTGAETARDAALLNADIYASTSAGLAATSVGNYFQTYSGNSNEYLILYRVDAGPVATLIKTYPSTAFFSFFQFADGYLDGGTTQYLAGWVDSYKRFSFGIQADGTFYAKKLAADAITSPGGSIDLDSVDTPQLGINGAGILQYLPVYAGSYKYAVVDANKRILFAVNNDDALFATSISGYSERRSYLDGNGYLHAVTDSSKRIALGVKSDGSIVVPSNAIESGSAAATSTALFTAERTLSDYEIYSYTNGAKLQLTSVGSNYAPVVTQESPARILFKSNRTGSINYHVMNQDGSKQALAHAPTSYALWGDSLTGNLRGIIPSDGHTAMTRAFLDGGLTTLGNERRLVNVGIGGQTGVQIAARQGGLATTCQVTGGQVPASGTVALTSVYPDIIYNPTLDGRLTNFPVTINGVAGTISRTDATNYTFSRTTAGSVVAASGTVTMVPVTTDAAPIIAIDGFAPTPFTGADLNEYTAIFWLGHNGIGGSNGETMVSLLNGCIASLRNISKRHLIIPIFNATTESGTGGYTNLVNTYWTPLASAFPANYYDIRRDFIDTAKTWMQANYPTQYASDWGQAYTSGGDIRAYAGTNSDYDVTKDMIPRALREDTIHLNAMGSDLFSELLTAKLKSLNW